MGRPWRALAAALLAAPALLAAQPPTPRGFGIDKLALEAVGLGVGGLSFARVRGAPVIEARASLGLLAPRVELQGALGFWSSRFREPETTRLSQRIQLLCLRQQPPERCPALNLGTVRLSDLSLALEARYRVAQVAGGHAYAGAGVALHFFNGQGDVIDDTFVEDFLDGVAPGLTLLAGTAADIVKPLRLFGELRAVLVPDVPHVAGLVGVLWRLPTPLVPP